MLPWYNRYSIVPKIFNILRIRNSCNELESSIIDTSTFSKKYQLDQGFKGNDNDIHAGDI
jgi:hypothetical protein